jgi:hypothetical protein
MSATSGSLDELDQAATNLRRLRARAREIHSAVRLPPSHRAQLLRALEAATMRAALRYRALACAAAELPPAMDRTISGPYRK